MKWDFAIGNPPYQQETENISLTNGQLRSKSVFHFFQIEADKIARESTVLIYPAGRWIQRSGKGMASFGLEQINDHRLSKVYFYPDSKEVFSSAAIADGISVVVKDMNKTSSGFDYIYCKNGKENGVNIENPGENIIPLNPKDIFPVIGEDEQGEMIALDAEKVLSIPRKIRSQEVVRRGFMSNYLFQNISGIFSAPQEVIDIISKFTPAEEPKAKDIPVTPNTKDELNINPETGDVEIPQEQVIGMAKDMFGDKIYATVEDGTLDTQIKSAFDDAAAKSQDAAQSAFDDFKEKFKSETVKSIIDIAKEKYQENIRVSDAKALEKGLNSQFDRAANKVYNSYQIEQNTAESDRLDALRSRHETGKSEAEIEAEFEQKKKELQDGLQEQLSDAVKSFIETSTQSVVETTEKKIKEREKAGIEDSVRDHLRGFSRTIPSFLMAYGDDTVTLATFDAVIPNPVFLEVTSITLDQFRFLRDGGKYTDAETGEERDFAGNLFDPVVFDDSVKEFLRLKKKLADYFDEKSIEDIFDYIPPQKTNQIFTPKTMVKKMVDMLEAENPGCFDDPDKTFIDLYMKSGLYITEIVKRLYQSEQMKKQFPDPKERLRHIFEKQVYGLAPTEIIYHIALSYILGFNEDTKDIKHNFRQLDALPYAKEGTLQQKLDELFS